MRIEFRKVEAVNPYEGIEWVDRDIARLPNGQYFHRTFDEDLEGPFVSEEIARSAFSKHCNWLDTGKYE